MIELVGQLSDALIHPMLAFAHQIRNRPIELELDLRILLDCLVGTQRGGELLPAQERNTLVTPAKREKIGDRLPDLLVVKGRRQLDERIRRGLEFFLERNQHGGILGHRRFVEHAGDKMGLGRNVERIAQRGNLIRHQILDHLARLLDRIIALGHQVEIEIVDERDQYAGQAFMHTEHILQACHIFVAGGSGLEIGQLHDLGDALPQIVEFLILGELGEPALHAKRGGGEPVLQQCEDRR